MSAGNIEGPGGLARLSDRVLTPVMFLLGGCRRDAIQETHYWHCERVAGLGIDPAQSVIVEGNDPSIFTNSVFPFPWFHAPIFGGWSRYVALRVQSSTRPWHIGWIHRRCPEGSRPRCHVQRLPIAEDRIRVLTHPTGFVTEFIAVSGSRRQLPLVRVGSGRLGDRQFPGTRLF